jgi:hypothetical protein
MGMYPSADLMYGVDLGLLEEAHDWQYAWSTDELEDEHGGLYEVGAHLLKEAGVTGVSVGIYGNFASGYMGCFLYTRQVHAVAYGAETVTGVTLAGPVEEDDNARLAAAWKVLYPGRDVPEFGWAMVVSYG